MSPELWFGTAQQISKGGLELAPSSRGDTHVAFSTPTGACYCCLEL